MEARVAGGKARCLIDSGAQCNLIDSEFVRKFGMPIRERKRILKMADGSSQESKGLVKVELKIGEWQGEVEMVVFKSGLDSDIILGLQFLSENNPEISWSTGKVKLFIVKNADQEIVGLNSTVASSKKACRWDYVVVSSCEKVDQKSIPSEVQELLKKYAEIVKGELKFPPERSIDHSIDLIEDKIVQRDSYRMSQVELDALKTSLDELLKNGFIRPSNSPYSSPVLFVKRKDGSLRMCNDFRALNQPTVPRSHNIPRIDELFTRLGKAKYFSICVVGIIK